MSLFSITNVSGSILSQQRYLPFGQERADVAGITQTDYGYTGQRGLGDMGLIDYKARFYSSYLNHWTQPDSIVPDPANPQAWNRYSYTLNNPIRYNDPTGHRIIDGCSELAGGCNITQKVIDDDKAKERYFKQRTEYLQCMRGDDVHCSSVDKLDRWAWQNIPSAISIHSGFTYQAGFGGEFGQFIETDFVFNWRSFEIDRFITTGHQSYIGTPTIGEFSQYRGITFIYGASSNSNLEGKSISVGATRGLDDVQTLSLVVQRSQGVDSNGVRFINRTTGRTVDSYQFDLSAGVSLFPTGVQTGGFIAETESNRINTTDLKGSMLFGFIFGS